MDGVSAMGGWEVVVKGVATAVELLRLTWQSTSADPEYKRQRFAQLEGSPASQ
jgi:hypothetical protein